MISTHKYKILPNGEITFDYCFNESMDEYYEILAQCKKLRFVEHSYFNKPIILPPCLTHVYFGKHYNQPTFLTHNLIHVVLGLYFNQLLVLPPNINYFVMGAYFNQSIILSKNLIHFIIGYYFNQPIILSKNIIEIHIGEMYTLPIIFSKYIKKCTIVGNPSQINLTKNIKYLYVSSCFKQRLFLNKNLVSATIKSELNYPIILGKNMKHLIISNIVKFNIILPKNLITFEYSHHFPLFAIIENPLKFICLETTDCYLIDNIPNGTSKIAISTTPCDNHKCKNYNIPSNAICTKKKQPTHLCTSICNLD